MSLSQNKSACEIRALKSEILYSVVQARAKDLGMRVNSTKTQMLCIGATGNCNNKTFIVASGEEKITSGNSLKILGFTFGTKPNVDEQVHSINDKKVLHEALDDLPPHESRDPQP